MNPILVNLNNRDLLIVPLPDDAYDVFIGFFSGKLCYRGGATKPAQEHIPLPPGTYRLLFLSYQATEEDCRDIIDKQECHYCGGDGKETCNNPDHGFIHGMGGELGRLGCPVCGHDPDYKIKKWVNGKWEYEACCECNGTGFIYLNFQDIDQHYSTALESFNSLLSSLGVTGSAAVLEKVK